MARATSRSRRPVDEEDLPNPWIALLPLVVVGVLNLVFTYALSRCCTAPTTP